MEQLNNKIKIYLDREVDFFKDVILQDDGDGPYIKEWNVTGLAQPTEEQLNALEAQANTLEASNQVITNRKSEYPSIEECVHAILDDNLVALQEKRTAVKLKYPKEGS
tara:strand:- start:21 stop:344 length:324 start_codon:yes stop_codon:yes gene_type:complete